MLAIWGTLVISNLQLENKGGKKYQGTIYTGNIIIDLIKEI